MGSKRAAGPSVADQFADAVGSPTAVPALSVADGSLVATLQRQSASTARVGQLLEVELSSVAPHPENARVDMGDLEGLASSIRELGVLQPLLVDDAARVLAERPELAEAIGDAQYLIRAGERRWRASRMAERPMIPIILAPAPDQLATYVTFIHENFYRKGLSPIEEARTFSHMIDVGLSQREIASRLGVDQAQVSRKLKLLTLPQDVQDGVQRGEVTFRDATRLTGLPVETTQGLWDRFSSRSTAWTLGMLIDEAERVLEREKNKAAHRAQIEERGDQVLENPAMLKSKTAQRLVDDDLVEAARSDGMLLAHPTPTGIEYYATVPIATKKTAETAAQVDEREAKIAKAARREAAAQLVQRPPTAGEAIRDLQRAVMYGTERARALDLAHRWLKKTLRAGLVGGEPIEDKYDWEKALRASKDADQRLWFAWALAIANDELTAAAPFIAWGSETADYLELLHLNTGYQPTDWEQARLKKIEGR